MATISIDDIVSSDLTGDGAFDKLMSAVELRLEAQYNEGRINGSQYAEVYLGALQGVLQQSIAYILGVQQADKQAELLVEQTKLVTEQILQAQSEKSLTDQKILTEQSQILDTVDGNPVVGTVGAQKAVLSTQEALNNQQAAKISADILKSNSEKSLLDQKRFTEEAQILDTVNSNLVQGVVGKQKDLYTRQADGFIRDAEVKAAKVFTDIWTIAKSTSPDDLELALPFNVDQNSLNAVLLKLAQNGLNMTEGELGTQLEISTASDPGAGEVIITTTVPHNLSTGAAIRINSVAGMTELNGNNYIITSTGATTFTLDGTDNAAFTTYTSGGLITVL